MLFQTKNDLRNEKANLKNLKSHYLYIQIETYRNVITKIH